MEWSVGEEAIFRRTQNCTLERKWNEQPQSCSVLLTLLNVSPDFEQKIVFIFFLILACILQFARYFLVTFNFLANWTAKNSPPPRIWVNYHSFWFTITFERWQSEIWNDILFWYFKLLLFFFPIAINVLNVKLKCRCFSVLVDWPDHQYHITGINSDSRGSKSNRRVSEKRNAVTLGRACYIDDELIVYNSITASQQSLATPVCLAGNWLISQIPLTPSMTMHLSKYCPSNHYIGRASLKHLQLFWL